MTSLPTTIFPKIAIIILNWNRLADTRECLDSLKKANYPNFKVILADNGSANEDGDILAKEYAGFVAVIKNEKNLGFAEGNNVAIRQVLKDTEVKYVFLLNNDTTVDPNFLKEAAKIATERSSDRATGGKVGMISIRMMNYYKPGETDSLGVELTRSALAFNIKNFQLSTFNFQLFCPCGGAALYSRELLEKIEMSGKYFDPDFFCYAEDMDLGFRARLSGFDCVLADKSIVYHKGSASTAPMSDFAVYHTYRNVIWVLIKNLPFSLFVKYLLKIIAGQFAIIFLYFWRQKPRLILKAYFDALKGCPEMFAKRREIQKNKIIKNEELNKYIEPKIFGKK